MKLSIANAIPLAGPITHRVYETNEMRTYNRIAPLIEETLAELGRRIPAPAKSGTFPIVTLSQEFVA